MAPSVHEMITYHPLETFIRTPPLGLRCVDVATRSPITAGLKVTATLRNGGGKPVRATPTLSGLHAFQGLPGLHDFEYGTQRLPLTSPPLASPPFGKEFAIKVEDLAGHFLPCGLVLTLPRREIVTAPLFSAPSRSAVPGFIAIRGGLKDKSRPPRADGTLEPAGFAHIKAQYNSPNATEDFALADARGEFVILLPPPNPLLPPAGVAPSSPNTAGRRTLAELRWPLTLTFFYKPAAQRFICTRAGGRTEIILGQQAGVTDVPQSASGLRCVPDLQSLLVQGAARVYATATDPPAATLEANIEFGKDLVVRTEGGEFNLWIEP
jgi:hypothetical protein